MAQVPDPVVPSVEPTTQIPRAELHLNVPNVGQQLGEAVAGFGQSIVKAGDLYGRVAADDASNQYQRELDKILYGDPNKPTVGPDGAPIMGPDGKPLADRGFLGLSGKAAADAWPSVQQRMDTLRENLRGGLSTLNSTTQFDAYSKQAQSRALAAVGHHADAQYKNWYNSVYTNTIETQIGRVSVDPSTIDDAMVKVTDAALMQGHIAGLTDNSDAMNNLVREARAKVVEAKAASIGVNDPKAALDYIDQSKAVLGDAWPRLHQALSARADTESGSSIGLQKLEQAKKAQPIDTEGTFTSFPPGAVAWNPKTGKALFPAKTNADGSPAPPGATSAADVVRDNAAGTADIARREKATAPASVDTIANAIHQQESGGRATSVTSVDNARGGWQIIPATFNAYKQGDEKIDNPRDNEAVGRRIIADLSKRFNGDPARVAVAYFSGPGNVAPAGSPTPWKTDAADGNGKRTSSYVSDVLKRMGYQVAQGFASNAPPAGRDVMGPAGPRARITAEDLTFAPGTPAVAFGGTSPPPDSVPISTAAAPPPAVEGQPGAPETPQAANAPAPGGIVPPGSEVQVPALVVPVDPYANALKAVDDDPNMNDREKAAARRTISERRTTDQLSYVDEERAQRLYREAVKQASDKAEHEIIQDLTSGKAINTVQSIGQNKALTPDAQLRMIGFAKTVNSGEGEASPAISGATTVRLMQDIGRPFGDPQKLTSLGPVIDAFNDHKLSRPDFEFLSKQIQQARSPEGEKLASVQSDFIKRVTPVIDRSNPLMGVSDPDGSMQLYRFTFDANEQIQYYMQHGKNPFDLFNPNKPDYLGSKENLAKYMTTMQQSIQTRVNQATGNFTSPATSETPVPASPLPTPAPQTERPTRREGEPFSEYEARVNAYIAARKSAAPPPTAQSGGFWSHVPSWLGGTP